MHSEFNKSKPLILIVDNDRDNLLLASCVVERMGMNFAVTNDSEKCLPLVKELSPDLILLNIVMPKINGLEIAVILKEDKNFSLIPLLAVTGLTKPEDKNKIMEAGFDDYLAKPYLIEDLEAKLRSLIKNL